MISERDYSAQETAHLLRGLKPHVNLYKGSKNIYKYSDIFNLLFFES